MNDVRFGWAVEVCRGGQGKACRFSLDVPQNFLHRLDQAVLESGWPEFVQTHVGQSPSHHALFRMALAGCANACSRPQIMDLGLLRAERPEVERNRCSGCGLCALACPEKSIEMVSLGDDGLQCPQIDYGQCLCCGRCVAACPEGAMEAGESGWRVVLGGRLGRMPSLAIELPGLYSDDVALGLTNIILQRFMRHWQPGLRFRSLLDELGVEKMIRGLLD
jgi:dissimilatory sulfite reductase (desulfoviridin) alpha/beta subunit